MVRRSVTLPESNLVFTNGLDYVDSLIYSRVEYNSSVAVLGVTRFLYIFCFLIVCRVKLAGVYFFLGWATHFIGKTIENNGKNIEQ